MTTAIDSLSPTTVQDEENQSLSSLMCEFDSDGQDARKIDYIRSRYAGFSRKEAGALAGVKIHTVNKWLKEDPRVTRMDTMVSTGQRKGLRKEVLQEGWYKNFYLVLQRDAYVLKKVHGILEEPYLEVDGHGRLVTKNGSPPMTKQDWDYYGQMRKMYSPDAWSSIEKALTSQSDTFNIEKLILNMAQNQQVNTGG